MTFRRIGLAATVAVAVGVLAALVAPGRPAAGSRAPAVAATAVAPPGRLELRACRLHGLSQDALCGTLRRPLDPTRPQGVQFDLHVAVLPAVARQKKPDPVFFFAGGPGQSAIALAGTVDHLLSRLGGRRDIVLVDQRGTGHSAPLQCDSPAADEALARAVDPVRLAEAMQACRSALEKLPWGDLRFYTTSLAMADADAVRAALGAERIDIVAGSYGTRAALEYLRLYPVHLRRAVLDGVAPADMALPESFDLDGRAALDAALHACASEPDCAHAHPGLADTWRRLLASLPLTADVHEPASGRLLRLSFTRDAVNGLVRPALYQPAIGAILPYAIEEAAAGRFDVLVALGAAQGGSSPVDLSEGEHFSVVCSEDYPRLPAAPASGGVGYGALYRSVCPQWPRGTVPPEFYALGRTVAPVLLLSGGADPVTPPRHAMRVAKALGDRARHVVVANSGHGVMALPCMGDALFRFINTEDDGEALRLDFDCAAKMPRPLAYAPLEPQRAASAPNDPTGFGDEEPRQPVAPPGPEPRPPTPTPTPPSPAPATGDGAPTKDAR